MRSQLIFKAEDPYERCGYNGQSGGCEHPRANHRLSNSGREFCLECHQSRPGAIASDVVHDFEPKKGITGSVPSRYRNTVPLSRVSRVAHPDPAEVHQHREQMLTGFEALRSRFHGRPFERTDTTVAAAQASTSLDAMRARHYGTARDKTEKSRGKKSPECPDCGSPTTTVYPQGEGAYTLYCDTCKREESYSPPRTQNIPDKLPKKYRKSRRVWKSRTPEMYSLTNKRGRTLTHMANPRNMSSAVYGSGRAGRIARHSGYSGASAGRMLRMRDRSSGIRGAIRQRFGAPKLSNERG